LSAEPALAGGKTRSDFDGSKDISETNSRRFNR